MLEWTKNYFLVLKKYVFDVERDFTYAYIKSIFALFPSVCNTLKGRMHLMEGYNQSIRSNIAKISVHLRIFSFNYAVYLICILAIIKKDYEDYIFFFFFFFQY